ncbi:hypothetical protein BAX97_14740 [Elizabethkingia meningoseptica]|nr:hypothetical protein BBD33_09050 [Elizabethkingia meningoseptica]EOR29187.1 hypothetical protein L100_12653 [Elizabethkingia meningoseptica ATCC 13253 = NBRC 12535]AQX47423.1 hypothetical protein B5G46_09040 [Elizabethkingia meningoseptica]KUY24311.1 hypothetical protein ATB99_02065 [Elizabethkingia meningoseptica]MDE5489507.1 hypothetical protein [Elizabethkingia meningoseptica]
MPISNNLFKTGIYKDMLIQNTNYSPFSNNYFTNKMKEQTTKKNYLPPQISIVEIEMEDCISAASAIVVPTNVSNQVQEDWTTGTDVTNDTPW